MEQILNVLEPAASNAILTLEEAKTTLDIDVSDGSKDAQILLLIDYLSGDIATWLNRTLGWEKVKEVIYEPDGVKRIFLTRWPVKLADITVFTEGGVNVLNDGTWTLEEKTGIIYRQSGWWDNTVEITYSAGYRLPEDAPDALKQAAMLVTREGYYLTIRGDSSVRSISHKESRVMYFSPSQMFVSQGGKGGGGGTSTQRSLENILQKFLRHWV